MVNVKSRTKTKRYLAAGLISLTYPLYFFCLWIYVAETTAGGQPERRELFLSYFPQWLQSSFHLTIAAIAGCLLAVLLGFLALPTSDKWLQAAALLLMGMASLLAAWFTLSLM